MKFSIIKDFIKHARKVDSHKANWSYWGEISHSDFCREKLTPQNPAVGFSDTAEYRE